MLNRDPRTAVSDKAFARKMLKGSGLGKKERAQIFINAGSVYSSVDIERVLRIMYPHVEKFEQQQGRVPQQPRPRFQPRKDRAGRQAYGRGAPPHRRPPMAAHVADAGDDEPPPWQDLEDASETDVPEDAEGDDESEKEESS